MNKRKIYQAPESIVMELHVDSPLLNFTANTPNPKPGGDPTVPGGVPKPNPNNPFNQFDAKRIDLEEEE